MQIPSGGSGAGLVTRLGPVTPSTGVGYIEINVTDVGTYFTSYDGTDTTNLIVTPDGVTIQTDGTVTIATNGGPVEINGTTLDLDTFGKNAGDVLTYDGSDTIALAPPPA